MTVSQRDADTLARECREREGATLPVYRRWAPDLCYHECEMLTHGSWESPGMHGPRHDFVNQTLNEDLAPDQLVLSWPKH
ncbi:hypothetical protein KIN20_018830 [Parelaphostrongylus tenuis]|uniref:Uncharacterized protein n=1 Tax=Parelaphostrongylus tenuis TaxID=148309 RepID=A0AAD5QPV9_PARTN|nr:hypothetical protein KIN20_018830 [Parelaphostrongylus tenuis]